MIAGIRGVVKERNVQQIMIEVNGLTLALAVPHEHIYSPGLTADVQVYFHWNQENGPQLFGFPDAASKMIFSHIISISGIGPKIGLAALASMTPEQFFTAIITSDSKALSSISGIGAKKAELIIMHLKDKFMKLSLDFAPHKTTLGTSHYKDLSQALASLHYSRPEITAAVEHVKNQESNSAAPFDELLRKSLAYLAKKL